MTSRCRPPLAQDMKPLLPNLVLATTYALNKSNTKRMCIGLEYHEGSYREVVKVLTSGAANKIVTFGKHDWEGLKEHFDTISGYFQNYYSFNQECKKPQRVFLNEVVLKFTSAYGTKSILFEERPLTEAQNPDEFCDDEEEEEEIATPEDDVEPPRKKSKKYFYSRGIVMQQPTFEGLQNQRHCVDLLLESLKEKVEVVNRCHSFILDFVREDLEKEKGKEDYKKILKDFKMFTLYFSLHFSSIESFIFEKMTKEGEEEGTWKSVIKIMLQEFLAFNLPLIFKDVRFMLLPVE